MTPEEVTEGVYRALVRGDLKGVVDHLHEDVIWYVAAPLPFAGEHVGKETVRRILVDEYGPVFRAFERRLIEFVEQSDGRFAGIVEARMEVGGRTVSTKMIHVHRIEDGVVVEWWLQPLNELTAREFWDALLP